MVRVTVLTCPLPVDKAQCLNQPQLVKLLLALNLQIKFSFRQDASFSLGVSHIVSYRRRLAGEMLEGCA